MRLRRDLCLGSLAGLPKQSTGWRGTLDEQLQLVKSKGYAGVVHWGEWTAIRNAGLTPIAMGRLERPEDAETLARRHKDLGLDFTTLHVGTGFESDAEMDAFAAAIIDATTRCGHELHVETHRATMTQDIQRTLDLAARFPDLPFTLDFSHWYTGHEMTYGGEFAQRLARLDPIFRQVRSVQIRVGDTGRIQRPLQPRAAFLADHTAALDRCFDVLGSLTAPPAALSFAPELLAATMTDGEDERWICYAEAAEEGDRFADALALSALGEARFSASADRTHITSPEKIS